MDQTSQTAAVEGQRVDDASATRVAPRLPRVRKSALGPVIAAITLGIVLYLTLGQSFQFSAYGEDLYDLHYLAGGWVQGGWPTPELWRPGSVVTHYYNLGLAGWGELGAFLGWTLGATYVLGLIVFPCVVFGLVFAMAGGGVWLRFWVALIATFPASGISIWVGLGYFEIPGHLQNMAHVRLTEWSDLAGESSLGQVLVTGHAYPVESLAHLVLDLENLHPPVMGFALFTLVMFWFLRSSEGAAATGGPELQQRSPVGYGHSKGLRILAGLRPGLLPGSALVLGYAINAWMLPVLLGTVLSLLVLRRCPMTVIGAVVGAATMWGFLWFPYFRHFEAPDAVKVTLLAAEYRSAIGSWLLIWGPYLAATVWWFGAVALNRAPSRRRFESLLPLVFLAAVLSLEIVHLDDAYGGNHERFNSVLKTGSVAMAGWAMSLLVLSSRQRWPVWLPIVLMLGFPAAMQWQGLAQKLGQGAHRANWALDEAAMIAEADSRALFLALQREPSGVTLEFTTQTAYTEIPLASTLAAMPTWSGWASHLGQVNAFSADDWKTRDRLQNWYRSFPPDNSVLDQHGIDFVLVRFALNWFNPQIEERQTHLGEAWEWVPLTQRGDGAWAGYFRRR